MNNNLVARKLSLIHDGSPILELGLGEEEPEGLSSNWQDLTEKELENDPQYLAF